MRELNTLYGGYGSYTILCVGYRDLHTIAWGGTLSYRSYNIVLGLQGATYFCVEATLSYTRLYGAIQAATHICFLSYTKFCGSYRVLQGVTRRYRELYTRTYMGATGSYMELFYGNYGDLRGAIWSHRDLQGATWSTVGATGSSIGD